MVARGLQGVEEPRGPYSTPLTTIGRREGYLDPPQGLPAGFFHQKRHRLATNADLRGHGADGPCGVDLDDAVDPGTDGGGHDRSCPFNMGMPKPFASFLQIFNSIHPVSYTHLTLPTIYSV